MRRGLRSSSCLRGSSGASLRAYAAAGVPTGRAEPGVALRSAMGRKQISERARKGLLRCVCLLVGWMDGALLVGCV